MPDLCGAPHCRKIIKNNEERAWCSLCSRIMHNKCQQHVIKVGDVRVCFFCNLSPEDTMKKVDSLKKYFSEKIDQKKKRQEKERNNKVVKDESKIANNIAKDDKRDANKKNKEDISNKNDTEYKPKLIRYIEDDRKMSEKAKASNNSYNIRVGDDITLSKKLIENSTKKIEFEDELNNKGVIKQLIQFEKAKSPEIKVKNYKILNGDDANYKIKSANQKDVPAEGNIHDHPLCDTKMEDINETILQTRIIKPSSSQPQFRNMRHSKTKDFSKLCDSVENNTINADINKQRQQHMANVLESVEAQNKLLETRINGLENTQKQNTWCTLT